LYLIFAFLLRFAGAEREVRSSVPASLRLGEYGRRLVRDLIRFAEVLEFHMSVSSLV